MIVHLVYRDDDGDAASLRPPRYFGTLTVPEPPAVGDVLEVNDAKRTSLIVTSRAWVKGSGGTLLRLLCRPNRSQDWHIAEGWEDR